MGKQTGFLEYERVNGEVREPLDRIKDFDEFHKELDSDEVANQGARCMDCGVTFCQGSCMIGGMSVGCPLQNLVPETNDLVYQGNLKLAYERLTKTHCFPEFTSRVCPALCEAACSCDLHSDAVATKENERVIIENAFRKGYVKAEKPTNRTNRSVAIVGSGPAGLSAAVWLNKRGHKVTIFERSDRAGGLLRYGIPNMKIDKSIIDRRIKIMEESGIEFKCGVNVGVDISGEELKNQYDRVILAGGASKPRDISVEGRNTSDESNKDIRFAVDFLTEVTKTLLDSNYEKVPYELCKDKNVVIIGGGDTGNDCVGTAIRLGAKSVVQLEMMPQPPVTRAYSNPWPEWPRVLKTDYGQEEAIAVFGKDPRVYQTTVKKFIRDEKGNLTGVEVVSLDAKKDKNGHMNMIPVENSEKVLDADLVLIAAGFVGSEEYVAKAFELKQDNRGNIIGDNDKIFVAGDMRRGQSLVVWAIKEGKDVAKKVDYSLMGYSNL